jgi:hypothetical protein
LSGAVNTTNACHPQPPQIRYDDRAGPTALTLLLVAVILIAIALAASSITGS